MGDGGPGGRWPIGNIVGAHVDMSNHAASAVVPFSQRPSTLPPGRGPSLDHEACVRVGGLTKGTMVATAASFILKLESMVGLKS